MQGEVTPITDSTATGTRSSVPSQPPPPPGAVEKQQRAHLAPDLVGHGEARCGLHTAWQGRGAGEIARIPLRRPPRRLGLLHSSGTQSWHQNHRTNLPWIGTLQKGPGEDRTLQKGPGEPPTRAQPSSLRQEPAWSPHTSFI